MYWVVSVASQSAHDLIGLCEHPVLFIEVASQPEKVSPSQVAGNTVPDAEDATVHVTSRDTGTQPTAQLPQGHSPVVPEPVSPSVQSTDEPERRGVSPLSHW